MKKIFLSLLFIGLYSLTFGGVAVVQNPIGLSIPAYSAGASSQIGLPVLVTFNSSGSSSISNNVTTTLYFLKTGNLITISIYDTSGTIVGFSGAVLDTTYTTNPYPTPPGYFDSGKSFLMPLSVLQPGNVVGTGLIEITPQGAIKIYRDLQLGSFPYATGIQQPLIGYGAVSTQYAHFQAVSYVVSNIGAEKKVSRSKTASVKK